MTLYLDNVCSHNKTTREKKKHFLESLVDYVPQNRDRNLVIDTLELCQAVFGVNVTLPLCPYYIYILKLVHVLNYKILPDGQGIKFLLSWERPLVIDWNM